MKQVEHLKLVDAQIMETDFRKERKVELSARNPKQQRLINLLENHNKHITFAIGPAGTGKTLISTLYAIRSLKNKTTQKIGNNSTGSEC